MYLDSDRILRRNRERLFFFFLFSCNSRRRNSERNSRAQGERSPRKRLRHRRYIYPPTTRRCGPTSRWWCCRQMRLPPNPCAKTFCWLFRVVAMRPVVAVSNRCRYCSVTNAVTRGWVVHVEHLTEKGERTIPALSYRM